MAHAFSRFSYYLCCLLLHNLAPGTFTTLLFLPIALLPPVIYYTPSFSSPFPLSLLYFPHPFTPHALPTLPKKCALNFYPTDLSGASWLPLKPPPVSLLSFSRHVPPHFHFSSLVFSPSLRFCLYFAPFFSIFSLTCCFGLSKPLSLPPVGTMWQGEMGWGWVSQVNRLKSAGEAWRFIWSVSVGKTERERERVCSCVYVYMCVHKIWHQWPVICFWSRSLCCTHLPLCLLSLLVMSSSTLTYSFCLRQKSPRIFFFDFYFL